jgi:hypothetical protein
MKKNSKIGPKGKFTLAITGQIAELIEKGATDKEVMKALAVSSTTFYRWIQEKKELRDTIQHAKRQRAQKLEPKLYKRANGYSYRETTRTRNSETGKMEISKIVTKHMAPDVAALRFYLMNYLPDIYNDTNHVCIQSSNPAAHELPPSVQEMLDELDRDCLENR